MPRTRASPALARLKKKLERIPVEVKREVRKALAAGAADVVSTAKNFAPVDDGDLKDSITWRFGDDTKIAHSQGIGNEHELSVVISVGNDRVRYAHLLEFGVAPHIAGGIFEGAQHPGAPAQPFFFPAYRTNKKRVKSRIARAMKKGCKAAVKG